MRRGWWRRGQLSLFLPFSGSTRCVSFEVVTHSGFCFGVGRAEQGFNC